MNGDHRTEELRIGRTTAQRIVTDLSEIILDTDQGLLMIKGINLHVKKLLVEKGEVEITGKIDSFLYSNMDEEHGKKEGSR